MVTIAANVQDVASEMRHIHIGSNSEEEEEEEEKEEEDTKGEDKEKTRRIWKISVRSSNTAGQDMLKMWRRVCRCKRIKEGRRVPTHRCVLHMSKPSTQLVLRQASISLKRRERRRRRVCTVVHSLN